MGSDIRVRFAPSPTGFLHIGGARTALFNWVSAKKMGGRFILRIEDTDRVRSSQEYVDEILDSMKWLGLNWDEGPVFQSERISRYKEVAEKLVKEGKAYISRERKNKGIVAQKEKKDNDNREKETQGEAIIFSVPQKEVVFDDLIRGKISIDSNQFGDIVLIKSDGMPAYNFACVVDDYDMGITHILRGEDHISNTPKQILIYEALGWHVPVFGHLPLILDKDRSRMSKRSGAVAVSEYRKMGFLPSAILNYLMLLGWAPDDGREVFKIDEIIDLFDVRGINKTGAVFDIEKLKWINSQHIKQMPIDELMQEVRKMVIERGWRFEEDYGKSAVELFRQRVSVLVDFVEWADYLWTDEFLWDDEAVNKHLCEDRSSWFEGLCKVLEEVEVWKTEEIEKAFRGFVAELGIKAKELIHPTRVAISGKRIGPGLFELMAVLGKETVIRRLSNQIKRWKEDGK